MEFTEGEAQAKKKAQQRIRVRDDSLSSYGIAKGTIGKVVDAKSAANVDVIAERVSRTGSKREEVVLVLVEFDVLSKQSNPLPFNKEAYESSLEEI
jgi:hypothetical protein